jgi:hypothetical protein
LPSRKSTEHHNGALVVTLFGHVRSVSTTGINGEYFSNCIFLGCVGFGAMVFVFRDNEKTP